MIFQYYLLALINPSELCCRLENNPRWISAFIFIGISSMLLSISVLPYTDHLTKTILITTQNSTNAKQTIELIQKVKIVGILFLPLMRIFKWLVLGTAIYYSAIIFNCKQIMFKQIFVVLVYAEIVLLIMTTVNVAILYSKEISSVTNVMDINNIVGLDIFLVDKYSDKPLYTLLNNINVFNIWYLTIVTVGVSRATEFTKLKSSIIVIGIWFAGLLFQVGLVALSSQMVKNMGM